MDSPYYFEGVRYWSASDERAHFEWLDRIGCIRSVRGRGRQVFLDIDDRAITESDLRELKAVYHRYHGDLSQLARIDPISDEIHNDVDD